MQLNIVQLNDSMSDLIVKTQAGKVLGKKVNGFDDIEFYSFKGIPYAKPPVGGLRFKDPSPVESWTGIQDAKMHRSNCAQQDFLKKEFVGSDDCLYLNVYARCVTVKQRWPVMVWIHGGAFMTGSGDDSFYGPDYLTRKDVVLVTINYRLGVLGFLNLDDEVATGNQGLKDQVMALKWVRDNIANFGGDPDNVTIFGESAGAASVHYLTISPLAKGLFHKAVSQSGVVLNTWAYRPNTKEKAYRLCEELGHTSKDPKSIVEFLRTIEVQKLIEAQEKIVTKEDKTKFVFPFGPSTDSKSKIPFLPVNPEEASAKGTNVPLIIGYNSREGIMFVKELIENLVDESNSNRVLHSKTIDIMRQLYNLNPDDLMRIYFANKSISKASIENVADFLGDLHFVEGIQRVIKNQIDKNRPPTYFYQFTYDKEPSIGALIGGIETSGASHGDELIFLFRPHAFETMIELPKKNSVKYKIMEQTIELWVNFATTGTPTPTLSALLPLVWQPVNDKTDLRYLNICENLRMEVTRDIGQQYIAQKYPKNLA